MGWSYRKSGCDLELSGHTTEHGNNCTPEAVADQHLLCSTRDFKINTTLTGIQQRQLPATAQSYKDKGCQFFIKSTTKGNLTIKSPKPCRIPAMFDQSTDHLVRELQGDSVSSWKTQQSSRILGEPKWSGGWVSPILSLTVTTAHRITESLRQEKTSDMIKSNLWLNTTS